MIFAMILPFLVLSGLARPAPGRVDTAMAVVKALSLEQRAGQMLLSFPPSPDYAARYWVGGVVMNQRHHIKSPEHTKKLTEAYLKAMVIPPLLSCDQEGGKVNRMVHIPKYRNAPSPVVMGTWPGDSVYRYAREMGRDMRSLGLNTNLAPCLDVSGTEKALQMRMARVFGGDPATVAEKGGAFAAGCGEGGVLVIAKHFPGYGDERWNSDVSLVKYRPEPMRFVKDLMVFVRVAPFLDGVMMSSLVYPDYDSLPACFSRDMVSLAHDIMPWGIVMTDDLWAPALREFVKKDYKQGFSDRDFARITRLAFLAGNDMLLILDDRRVPEMIRTISDMCREDPALEKQLNLSVARILLAKDRLYPGLLARLYGDLVEGQKEP